MSETQNLGLPYIEAGQAQKHVTHNEALRQLDTLVQLAVQDRDLATPPGAPAEGQRWIVKAAATDAWTSRENQIAAWQDGAWEFSAPSAGWLAYVIDEAALVVWNGTAWTTFDPSGAPAELQNMSLLGVGTEADTTNPVSARLNNVLWAAKTVAEGGDGTLRYKLSKESADKTLSFLLQDDFVGCAEIGLTGDDDFHFKMSPDGTAWLESIRIDRATGKVSFPSGGAREVLSANRTYYVRTDGSDANNGLTDNAGGAFATVQKAWDTLVTIDLNGFAVTIKLGDAGTRAAGLLALVAPVGGNVVIEGDTAAPSNTVISTTGTDAIRIACAANVTLQYLKLETATGGECVRLAHPSSKVIVGNGMNWGACADAHMRVEAGLLFMQSPAGYTISGDALYHYFVQDGGVIQGIFCDAILSDTPAFSACFANAQWGGLIDFYGFTTASGTATGTRFNAANGGKINTYSGGADYWPGNSAGTGTNFAASPFGMVG